MQFVNYDWKNLYNSSKVELPGTVHVKNTGLAKFFKDYLFKKLLSQYIITLPKNWDMDYFRYVLFLQGFIVVFDEGDQFGVIPQGASLAGFNVFYRPTTALIANPVIKGTRKLKINEDCTVIKLTPNYKGVWDIIEYYGDMLALCAESVGVNLVNTHLSYVFTAGNKSAAESFKKLYDDVASGQPAVVQDKNLLLDDGSPAWHAFEQNLKQTFITTDLLDAMNTIENQFDNLVGIPSANTDKRERLVTDEVAANNIDTNLLRDIIFEMISDGMERARKMFKMTKRELNIKLRYKTVNVEGGLNNEP